MTSFSELPLETDRAWPASCISALGFCYALVLIFIKLSQAFGFSMAPKVIGFTTLAVAVLFIGGFNFSASGLLESIWPALLRKPNAVRIISWIQIQHSPQRLGDES